MLVMKFGGASVATPDSFHQITEIIREKALTERQIVVVVSAMANKTDELLSLARAVNPNPPERELDMLVSVGERISISLLAMALSMKGIKAVSFTGSQSGIITTDRHSEAKIIDVTPHRIVQVLEKGCVAIVAGFQGVSRNKEITTLGRGGSDTSAVALAVALGADTVEFYKDVGGIFSADPKKDPQATLQSRLTYKEALAIGGKVLHARSLELAEKNGIKLAIHSFLSPKGAGTVVEGATRRLEKLYEEILCC